MRKKGISTFPGRMSRSRRCRGPENVLIPFFLLGGCAAGDPIAAWQGYLESYVAKQGNGDPNVLRTTGDDPAHREFGMIGATRGGVPFVSPRRADATGLLLGHRRAAGRSWFVFLVGAVEYRGLFVEFPLEDPRVTEIRLAAWSPDGGAEGTGRAFVWCVGDADREALRRYVDAQRELWRRTHPERADADDAPSTFPSEHDAFRLEAADDLFTVRDEHSGASWTVPLDTAPAGIRKGD